MPNAAPVSREWLTNLSKDEFGEEICLLTDNDAGDDGWVIYNFKTKTYAWDGCCKTSDPKTLKSFLQDNIKHILANYSEKLSDENKKLIQEYIKSI